MSGQLRTGAILKVPLRVVIAGAGSVGRSIARELLHNGHQVLLIDKDTDDVQASRVPEAARLLADACERWSVQVVAQDLRA